MRLAAHSFVRHPYLPKDHLGVRVLFHFWRCPSQIGRVNRLPIRGAQRSCGNEQKHHQANVLLDNKRTLHSHNSGIHNHLSLRYFLRPGEPARSVTERNNGVNGGWAIICWAIISIKPPYICPLPTAMAQSNSTPLKLKSRSR